MLWIALLGLILVSLLVSYRQNRAKWGLGRARARAIRSVLTILGLYVGVTAVLLWLENSFIYLPQSVDEFWHPPANLRKEDVHFKSQSGDDLHGWWCPQARAKWTILFSHGNAGNLSGHSWIIPSLREAVQANVFIYDYPGYGKSGGKPSESGCYAAAQAAYAWLIQEKQIDPDALILMGQSLGCAMACELVDHPHRAMVLLSPFTSIRELGQELFPIFPVRWLMRHSFDNIAKLSEYDGKLLIGHGDADEVVPFRQGEKLFAAVRSQKKVLHRIKNGTHNELDAGFFREMNQFLQSLEVPHPAESR